MSVMFERLSVGQARDWEEREGPDWDGPGAYGAAVSFLTTEPGLFGDGLPASGTEELGVCAEESKKVTS